jgi:hypothetical protein
MRFFNRITRWAPIASGPCQKRRPAGRSGSRIELETLEGRALMAGLTGVSLSYGNLAIEAPKTSGNVAAVSIDPSTKNVEVTLNGQSEEFSASSVYSITYKGGSGGGDTFVDNTSLPSVEYGFGGHNAFTGGTGFNYAYFWGNSNTYTAEKASYTDVFEYGTSDTIINPDDAGIQLYVY